MSTGQAITGKLAACAIAAAALPTAAGAADPATLTFQTHAAFFSSETKQAKPLDPQVFVLDAQAPAATGPQGIKHAAGVRPVLIQADAGSTPMFNAEGKPLGFTLTEWLAAAGTVAMTPTAAGPVSLKATFQHLRPDAQYSLFENHFDQTPIGFTPLDGAGTANSFRTDAKGDATVTVTAPQPLTHANAVVVILDDDGQAHGASRGEVGINALHQLIARPAS